MSLASGMAALHLEMTDMVPRTEYSAPFHPALVKAVTGYDVKPDSDGELVNKAAGAFMEAWDFALQWRVGLLSDVFGKYRVNMGHAEYAAGGVDRDDHIYCAFRDEEDVLRFDPMEAFGPVDVREWTKKFSDDYHAASLTTSDTVNMTGTYITCVSGLIELFGWDLLLTAAGVDPQGFGEVANRYARWMQPYYEALAQCDSPTIMVHDDIVWTEGPFIHPDWYRTFVFPHYKTFFAPLLEAGKKILFTSDGNYTMFLDDIAQAGAQGFVLEPVTDLETAVEKYGKTHVIVGNADTRILLQNDREAIYQEVKRCMDTAKHCPGFIMAVGNHIPANTPVEAALYYDEVYRKLGRR